MYLTSRASVPSERVLLLTFHRSESASTRLVSAPRPRTEPNARFHAAGVRLRYLHVKTPPEPESWVDAPSGRFWSRPVPCRRGRVDVWSRRRVVPTREAPPSVVLQRTPIDRTCFS